MAFASRKIIVVLIILCIFDADIFGQGYGNTEQQAIQVQAKGVANVEITNIDGKVIIDKADAIKKATENALQNAVRKALGIYVRSFEKTEAGRLVASKVSAEYEGLIKDYTELSRSFSVDGMLCEVWIQADVYKQKAFEELSNMAEAEAILWQFTPKMIGNPSIFSESNNKNFKDILDQELAKEGFIIYTLKDASVIQIEVNFNEINKFAIVKITNSKSKSYTTESFELDDETLDTDNYFQLAKIIISRIYSDTRNFTKSINLEIQNISRNELKEFKKKLVELCEIVTITDLGYSPEIGSRISLLYSGNNTDELIDSLECLEKHIMVQSYDQQSLRLLWEAVSEKPILKLNKLILDYDSQEDMKKLESFESMLLTHLRYQTDIEIKDVDWQGSYDYEILGTVCSNNINGKKHFTVNFSIKNSVNQSPLLPKCEITVEANRGILELAKQASQTIIDCFQKKFFCSIIIQSNLPSCILLNGEKRGNLPLSIGQLIPGEYKLYIFPEDSITYIPIAKEFVLSPGQKINESVFFDRRKRKVLLKSNVSQAMVTVNYSQAGFTDNKGEFELALEKGEYRISLSHKDYIEKSHSITVNRENILQSYTINFNLQPIPKYASIDIKSNYFGEVWLNGEYLGSFPRKIEYAIPGKVVLSLKRSGYNMKFDTTFIVNEGSTVTIIPNFGFNVPEIGWIYVDSEPQFARIYLNDRDNQLNTPALLEGLLPGKYKISLDFFNGSLKDTMVIVTRNDTLRIKLYK